MKKAFLLSVILTCGLFATLCAQEAPAQTKPLRYKVGDLFCNDDMVGIVFTVDVTGRHGKLLSLVHAPNPMTWEEAMTYCSAGTWYLPSKDELILIFQNKEKLNEELAKVEDGELLNDGWYWTSEEYGKKSNKTKKSWFVSMEDANFYYLDWDQPINVRAVSAF